MIILDLQEFLVPTDTMIATEKLREVVEDAKKVQPLRSELHGSQSKDTAFNHGY